MIRGEGLRMSFGGLEVLSGVDLSVGPSEVLGLMGPNGAGKSTLFNLFSGVIQPKRGKIFLGDHEVRLRNPTDAAKFGIARTFQTPRPLTELTVLENLKVATPDHPFALECLAEVSLQNQYDRNSGDLNLMDRKRLEIARALALKPRVLLLDEAMAGLTASEMEVAIELIRKLKARGLAVIWVEHVISALLRTCDRIAVLNQGKIIREGSPSTIMEDPEVKRIYLGEKP